MPRDDSVCLKHIRDAISKIEGYTKKVDLAAFKKNTLIQDGVIRQIEIVGEASKRLSGELRARYAHIPWQDIVGMRDKLIHDYFGVDIENVWLTLKNDIPTLKKEVNRVLKQL